MSPTSTQQWTRRIRYADQNIRVSDAERNAVAEQLGAHYADGRLDQAEFDERIARTMSAKTRGDLSGLFDDLPDLGPAGAPGMAGPSGPGAALPYPRRRRGGIFRPLVLLAIVIVAASVSWHAINAFSFFAIPWFPIAVVVAIVLIATHRHHHHDHDRR